eukprot:6781461-Alexandrium_andersonii.AAC.1
MTRCPSFGAPDVRGSPGSQPFLFRGSIAQSHSYTRCKASDRNALAQVQTGDGAHNDFHGSGASVSQIPALRA